VLLELESAECAAYADAYRGSPKLCEVAEIGGALCLAVPRFGGRLFNRVLGLSSLDHADEISAFYGGSDWWVSDSSELGAELEARGFVRDYGWMKFSRGVGPREARSDLAVVPVEHDRAADFGVVVAGGYDLPEWAQQFAANVVGRPGWSCFVAYDDDRPAGAGALFVDGTVGWLGFGSTLPHYRGRGAQSAILAARIEDARRQGCTTLVTETGELEDDRPSNSYRNIVRAGFREAGVRPNYRAPAG
jgi:GNAT superfamily N-acetyltransferase